MNVDIGAALEEAVNRLLTPAGAVLAVAFAVAGILQTIGIQELMLAWVSRVVEVVAQTDPQQAADLERQMETAAGQGLSFGLGIAPAAALLILGFVGGLVVLVLAIDAFASDTEDPGQLGTDGFVWKLGNLVVGWVIWAIFVLGFWWFFLVPAVIGWLTMFFPIAIVLEGKWFGAAYFDSYEFVRENLASSIVLGVLAVVLFVGTIAVQNVASIVPTVVGPALGLVVRALGWTLLWALLTVTYVSGTDSAAGTAGTESVQQPGQAT